MKEIFNLAKIIQENTSLSSYDCLSLAKAIDDYIDLKLKDYDKNKENDYVKYCTEIAERI